ESIKSLVFSRLEKYLDIRQKPDLIELFRHPRAIPQYEASTDRRLELIRELERDYPGLIIGGNMLGGIGMPDRIKQGVRLAEQVLPHSPRT
ncbi:MAG: protoporphyrinogen oxidase, partial [Porphyromonas sp.]|nr:protoporphyrinogen oxidase [Porphyromonas sp.]